MRKKAFTIVEVVVAIGVLLVGVLGVATFFAYSTKIVRTASDTSIASNLAQGILDQENAQSYDQLTPGTGMQTRISTDPNSPFYKFQKQININLIDQNLALSTTDVGLKKIDVYISYPEGNTTKNVQMSTIKAKK
jgi:Tfp pilus assembly protein PilV